MYYSSWIKDAAENYAEIYKHVYAATKDKQLAQGAANQLSAIFIMLRVNATKEEAERRKAQQTPAEAFMDSLARQMVLARMETETKEQPKKEGVPDGVKRRPRKDEDPDGSK